MKIEVGKFYKTRDGQKVGPMKRNDDNNYDSEWEFSGSDGYTYRKDGTFGIDGTERDRDLIAEWTETTEVGTLQDIGARVGDVVREGGEPAQEIVSYFPLADKPWTLKKLETGSVDTWYGDSKLWRIISRAQPKHEQTGPVRTVTRKEIVPGVYGAVVVEAPPLSGNGYVLRMNQFFVSPRTAEDLTAAITTLTAIRDALKENGE